MKNNLLVILLFFALFSCTTTKRVIKEDVKASAQNDITEIITSHEESKTETGWFMSSDELMTLIEKIMNTKYSQPDSAGKQYVTTTTTIEREYFISKKGDYNENITQHTETDITSEKQDNSTTDLAINTEENEIKKKNHAVWIIPLILATLLFISILINVLQVKRR